MSITFRVESQPVAGYAFSCIPEDGGVPTVFGAFPSIEECTNKAMLHAMDCAVCAGAPPVVERAQDMSEALTLGPKEAVLVLSEPELAGDTDVATGSVGADELAGRILIALALLPEKIEHPREGLTNLYRLTQLARAANRKVQWF